MIYKNMYFGRIEDVFAATNLYSRDELTIVKYSLQNDALHIRAAAESLSTFFKYCNLLLDSKRHNLRFSSVLDNFSVSKKSLLISLKASNLFVIEKPRNASPC